MNDDERHQHARRKVRQMRGFYIHALVWAAVNVGLFFINIMTWPGYLWCLWPAFAWGLALAIHGLAVFGLAGFLGPDWEDRKIKEILERDEKSS
jgi:hypothetical protein